MKSVPKTVSPLLWVIISAIGFVLFLGAAIAFLLLNDKIGIIKPQIYFFLVVILGLVCAAFLSGALKSHAKYTGKVYGGTLELGGPVLVLVVLIFLGFKFMPKKDMFVLKFNVFANPSKTALINDGQIKLFLSKPDSQKIINGYASFTDIDTKYQGKKIDALAMADGYETNSQTITVPAADMPVELFLIKKLDSVNVSGIVIHKNGQPVKDALIVFENGVTRLTTDLQGNFSSPLPFKDGKEISVRVYDGEKLVYNGLQILSRSVSMTLQIE